LLKVGIENVDNLVNMALTSQSSWQPMAPHLFCQIMCQYVIEFKCYIGWIFSKPNTWSQSLITICRHFLFQVFFIGWRSWRRELSVLSCNNHFSTMFKVCPCYCYQTTLFDMISCLIKHIFLCYPIML
jgi:hypothetical protein